MIKINKEIMPYREYSKKIRALGKERLEELECPLCKTKLELNLDMWGLPWHFHCKNRDCPVEIHCIELKSVLLAIPYVTEEHPYIELRENQITYWE